MNAWTPLTLLSAAALTTTLACSGALHEAPDGGTLDSGIPDAASPFDAGAPLGDASRPGDGGVPLPAECANPGPYFNPTSVATQIAGKWIYCDKSIFVGCSVPLDDVGIEIRSDGTWQKLGFANGAVVALTTNVDIGTWTETSDGGGSVGPSLLFSWNGTSASVGVAPKVSPDGRTMQTSTSAGGNTSNMAKETGTP